MCHGEGRDKIDMLYSEFIELSGLSENLISYGEYKNFIEPIYMENENINKMDFVNKLIECLDDISVKSVMKLIGSINKVDRANLLSGRGKEAEKFKTFYAASRKIAYNMLRINLEVEKNVYKCID